VAFLLLALYEKVPFEFIVLIPSPRTLYLLSVLDVTKVDLPLDAKPPSPEVIVPMIDLPEIVIGADTGAGTFKSSRLSLPHPTITKLNKALQKESVHDEFALKIALCKWPE
jgi:hypothetical protein